MAKKFTFKREPRATGLAGIGDYHPTVVIKLDKKQVGNIIPPNWASKEEVWKICFAVEGNNDNSNCTWHWITLKKKCNSEEEAREFLKDNAQAIIDKYELHSFED